MSSILFGFWCQANGPSPQTNLCEATNFGVVVSEQTMCFSGRVTSHTGTWDTNQAHPPRLIRPPGTFPILAGWPVCISPTDSLTILAEHTSGKVFSNTFLRTTSFLVKTNTKVFVRCCLATNPHISLRGPHLRARSPNFVPKSTNICTLSLKQGDRPETAVCNVGVLQTPPTSSQSSAKQNLRSGNFVFTTQNVFPHCTEGFATVLCSYLINNNNRTSKPTLWDG